MTAAATQPTDQHPPYTDEELRAALNGLLDGSDDPAFDGRHLFGRGDPRIPHELSKLQVITATRILDYDRYLSGGSAPSEESLLEEATTFWADYGPLLNLRDVITARAPRMALAAEFKRASPSKGDIARHLDAGEQGQTYATAGADIISVLTEPRWFLGSLDDLTQVRTQTVRSVVVRGAEENDDGSLSVVDRRPAVLRKEFTTSRYQITEALAHGADTVLLIVAVLPQHLLADLIRHARSFGMEPLVEVHADVELEVAIQAGAKVIGVNNRNLHTFQMDLRTTERVAERLLAMANAGGGTSTTLDHSTPANAGAAAYTLCSLSGMSTALDVDRYRQIDVGMCLIGESLMRAADPGAAIAGLCLDPRDWDNAQNGHHSGGVAAGAGGGAYTGGTKLVKVCGITNPEDALVACQAGANLIGVIFVPNSKRCVTAEVGRAVVEAVRAFGERTERGTVHRRASSSSPLSQMASNARALEDATRGRPLVVGVFQNQTPDFIAAMVDACGLDVVQLHGNEGMEAADPAFCGGVPAIRVVDVETDPTTGRATVGAVDALLAALTSDPLAILLDTSLKGKAGGGTGVAFDWTVAERVQNYGLPVIIAGGLSPENVCDAVTSIRPWGVDVSSGVEAGGHAVAGTKDHAKVRAFVSAAREAATEAAKGF